MLANFLKTKPNWEYLILRLTLAMVIFPHGAQKVFGWFGGFGFSATMNFFTTNMGIPYIFALAAVLAESLGVIGLILGLGTRLAALGVGITIGVAAFMGPIPKGQFFMNWFGKLSGEGFEYHLLVVGIALALIISGGGRWSLDQMLSQKIKS